MPIPTTLKSRLAATGFGSMLITGIILSIISISQGWGIMQLADLPILFWLLYGIFVISVLAMLLMALKTPTQSPQLLPLLTIAKAILYLTAGVVFLALAITDRQWRISTLNDVTIGLILLYLGAEQLIRYLRARTALNLPRHNK